MPLIKSGSRAAVGTNISEMEATGHPHAQAVAAALNNARKYGARFAPGGVTPPFGERMAARQLMRDGFLNSTVPGRTDKLPITVGGGAFVLPADHVAAVGQGNSLSGADIVNRMFKLGPYGTSLGGLHQARAPIPKLSFRRADGGAAPVGTGHPTDISAAGGEIVIPPEKIIERFGDLDKGHEALKQWVLRTRAKHIKTLKNLPGPH